MDQDCHCTKLTSHIARCSASSMPRSSGPRRDRARVGSVSRGMQVRGGGIQLNPHDPELLCGIGQPRLFISECGLSGRNPTREGQKRLVLEHDLLGDSLCN